MKKAPFDSASAGTVRELDDILNNSAFATQFLIYLEKRSSNTSAVWEEMGAEDIQQEFLLKCQWIQHYARTKLGASDITLEIAATIVNTDKCISFNKKVCDKMFDGFIHFAVANETRPSVLNSIIKTWVAQGRELTELDPKELTPLQVSVYTKNVASLSALAHYGVDITVVDAD